MDQNRKLTVVEIVDDEVLERNALRDKLTQAGYGILEAKDGEEGLSIALANHPNIILLDLRMPKMDGMTMMQKLRADAWGKDAPIIILTNYDANDQNVLRIITDHPSYYLLKTDTSIDEIIEKIREVLESKKEEV